jgi:hypothetical protein
MSEAASCERDDSRIAELIRELTEGDDMYRPKATPLGDWDRPDDQITPGEAGWPERRRQIKADLRELGAAGYSDPPLGE